VYDMLGHPGVISPAFLGYPSGDESCWSVEGGSSGRGNIWVQRFVHSPEGKQDVRKVAEGRRSPSYAHHQYERPGGEVAFLLTSHMIASHQLEGVSQCSARTYARVIQS
jgi:hypothetical protein